MPNHQRRSIAASPRPHFKQPNEEPVEKSSDYKNFTEIIKAKDERIVYGVVLEPDTVDAHGDTMSAEVIKAAAHNFLKAYNKSTKLGLQHKSFNKKFELLESYIAPHSITLGNKTIKEGSWVLGVKVLDDKIWKGVKDGDITGFSIGGKAKVQELGE